MVRLSTKKQLAKSDNQSQQQKTASIAKNARDRTYLGVIVLSKTLIRR